MAYTQVHRSLRRPAPGGGLRSRRRGLGELVTPDRTVWFPDAVRAWLNQVNEQIRALDTDIASHRARIAATADGPRFLTDFEAFKQRWLRFNHNATTWSGGTIDGAQEYVNAYNVLERRFRTVSGTAPTVYAELSPDEAPSALRSANYALMGWALIGIVGLLGTGYVISSYARVKTLSKLAFNPRRRRRSR